MKLKRILTMGLAAIMIATTVSIPTFADNGNEVVYSYIDTNGDEVNITQAEYEAEHWDKDALGDTAPFIYNDFPMHINNFVDDYSDMSLSLTYLKDFKAAENVSLTITNLSDDTTVFDEQLDGSVIAVPNIEVNKTYKLTISETFDGVTTEYNKAVVTSIEKPEMPDYITDADTDDETIILVGNVDDLHASTIVDENGDEEILEDMPRYVQVKACDFSDYVANLEMNKLYRIYTHASDGNIYVGFISTSGDVDGIFMPTISIYKWDTYITSMQKPKKVSALRDKINLTSTYQPDRKLEASDILNSTIIDMDRYRDYEILYDTSKKEFQAYRFIVPEDSLDVPFDMVIRGNDSITVEIWTQQEGETTPTYQTLFWRRNGTINLSTLMHFNHTVLNEGDVVYFAVYFNGDVIAGEGTISIQKTDIDDDVTGSAYQAYQNFLNGDYTQYTAWTPFYITDDRDVDTFFLTYGTSSKKNYIKIKPVLEANKDSYNGKYTVCAKNIEFSYTPANESTFYTSYAPSDVKTMLPTGAALNYTKTSTTSNKRFVSIYNAIGGNTELDYDLDIYLFKRYNN